jgi:hypothetical protein
MTLIKKSDVHRHLSTKSRENREQPRPYGVDNPAPESVEQTAAPAAATNEVPALVSGQETQSS